MTLLKIARMGHPVLLQAAEAIADIARATVGRVVREIGQADESAVQQQVIEEIRARGFVFDDPPIVAFGPNAADPHYSPEPGTSADAETLTDWCRETLSAYKVPSLWEIREEPLPRNAAGKVVKTVLTGEAAGAGIEE